MGKSIALCKDEADRALQIPLLERVSGFDGIGRWNFEDRRPPILPRANHASSKNYKSVEVGIPVKHIRHEGSIANGTTHVVLHLVQTSIHPSIHSLICLGIAESTRHPANHRLESAAASANHIAAP